MQDDTIVKVKGVSKKFCRDLKLSMLYGVQDISRNLIGVRSNSGKLRKSEFWAVNDVSFELHKGETLGIIGFNGAGKSTILKMLNGIFMPDKGKIEIKGKVGALIEIGAGFHPLLTGHENIYVNGAILGMSKREIEDKFDDIVKFADIGDFIDAPVRSYSAGMFVRLGFAVAIHREPDLLLIDEVLAVGDIKFINKSYKRIEKLQEECSTVLVSHQLPAIRRHCEKALWIDKGKIRMHGETQEVIREYSSTSLKESLSLENTIDETRTITGDIHIEKIELYDGEESLKDSFSTGDDLIVRCYYSAKKDLKRPFFRVTVAFQKTGTIFGASMISDGTPRKRINSGTGILECRFKKIPLREGIYQINISIISESRSEKLYRHEGIKDFEILKDEKNPTLSFFTGPVVVQYHWNYKKGIPEETKQ